MLSGAPSIEPIAGDFGVLDLKMARLVVPTGKTAISIPMLAETADKIQKVLTLEIVDYAE
jgi:hypothetical protein